ncbi:MAG: N-acetylmuramoyl-L-alanine amidase [Candidatus Omnitrophota bacterium]
MKNKIILSTLFLALFLSSCARAPVRNIPVIPTIPGEPQAVPESAVLTPDIFRQDVIHEVGPGETVWRIGKMYDVPIEDIVRVNNLSDATQLEKGQRLIISNAAPMRSVIPLYPGDMWKYIIIHHSATDIGNALSFDYMHSHKRLWKGLGYHFVIDNGTAGTKAGHIEISPRWLHQEYGAHCKADEMNYRGIGICLVGNFNDEKISSEQMDSLVYLINILKKYYNIPDSHILGHGRVNGAKTDCPGTGFPWAEFRSRLRSSQ